MNKIKRIVQQKEYVRFFLMFFSGTLFAQIITFALSPFLTRIYTPEDFGVYGVYLSIVALLMVFVTGRYEYAINSTESEDDAISLFKIVNYFSAFSSGFILIIIVLAGDSIVKVFGLTIDNNLLYLIPLTLLLIGFLQGSSYYLNRQKQFAILTKSKVYQSITNGFTSLGAGLIGFGAFGMILANIIGVFTSQLYQRLFGIRKLHSKKNISRINFNIKRYKQYPLYNAPSAFFDNLAIQAPIFILLKFFSESIVGFYSLTVRVIGMPLGLISTSISQVFLSQVSELHRENKSYKAVIIKVAKYLALVGVLPLIVLSLWGPMLFAWVFGGEWAIAGEYARILSFGYFFKFVVSPLSMVFFINQKVKLLSTIQTIRASTTIIILVFFSMSYSVKTVLYAYTIHEIIFYLIYFRYILKTSK